MLNRPIRYEPIAVDAFAASLRQRGMPEYLIQHLSNVAVDYQHGIFAGTNDLIERIGGAPGTLVAAFVREHRTVFEG